MHSIKWMSLAAVFAVVAGINVIHGADASQPSGTTTNQTGTMKDFKKPDPAQLQKKLSPEQDRKSVV